MPDQQKILDLCSILDELFFSFHPHNPPGILSDAFFECILGRNHLERLKMEYEEIKEKKDP